MALLAFSLYPGGYAFAENSDSSRSGKNPIAEKYDTLVMRVYFRDRAERDRMAQELNAEEVPTTGGYLTIIRDRDLYYGLTARGLRVEIDENSSTQPQRPSNPARNFLRRLQVGGRNTYAFLDQKVAQFPDLVEKVDIGDSAQGQSGARASYPVPERLRSLGATHHEPQHTRPKAGLLGGRRYTRPRDRYARSRHAHD